ncbi:MAG: tetratricopeptide repeat protein, partial [Nitrosomonadaceae bacterium]
MKTWILLIATILSLCSSVSRADGLEGSVEAYNKGNYAQALELLRPLAAQGIANAQNSLGFIYHMGKGVAQDYQEAMKWYHLAAEQGHAIAQNNLGFFYDVGKCVTQDYQEAVKWYRLAAEQGHA